MSSLSSVEVVQAIYEAFGRRDIAKAFALLHPDVVITQSDEVPWGGTYRGHEGAQRFFSALTKHLNSKVEMERLIRAGDHVVAIGWTQGTVNTTGATFRVPFAHVWRVANGLATDVHFHIDHPTMLPALARAAGSGSGAPAA
jgi:ketosteroid isomerase-like protein